MAHALTITTPGEGSKSVRCDFQNQPLGSETRSAPPSTVLAPYAVASAKWDKSPRRKGATDVHLPVLWEPLSGYDPEVGAFCYGILRVASIGAQNGVQRIAGYCPNHHFSSHHWGWLIHLPFGGQNDPRSGRLGSCCDSARNDRVLEADSCPVLAMARRPAENSALSQSIADLNAQGPKFDVHIEDVAWGGQSTNPEYQNVVIAVATVTIKNLGRMPSVATGWNLTALRDGKTYQARLIAAQGPITMSMPRRADGKIISAVYPPEEFIVRKTSAPIQIGALVQGYIFGTFSDLDSTRTDLKLIVTCVDVLGKSYEASENLVGRYDENLSSSTYTKSLKS